MNKLQLSLINKSICLTINIKQMRINNFYSGILMLGLFLFSCESGVIYKNNSFTIENNKVTQGKFTASVVNSKHLKSNYEAKNLTSSILEFKFSLNGKDNELPFGVNHRTNIYADGTTKLVKIEFGKKASNQELKSQILPKNSKLKIQLNMKKVIDSFNKKGFYIDIHGEKIFKKDFQGVYIAGNIYPLNWDFENFNGNKSIQLTDSDKDGIYEIELTMNTHNPDAFVASEWKLKNDIKKYPQFKSTIPLLDAVYNMSLDEMVMNMEKDGTFRTGAKWPGVWTRDISYSIVLALSMLEPQYCMNSLKRKVANGKIIQDTGTGGAWPVSSDRMVWAIAAWEIYKYTGNREWLYYAFSVVSKSANDDLKTIYDKTTGLVRGESSFLDWRKQTYPLWMQPADIQISQNLGTNAAYYKVLDILAQMANELDFDNSKWETQANLLKQNINKHLWSKTKGYYGQYLYGRNFMTLSDRSEALGESFTVLFDIADEQKASEVLKKTPVVDYGAPCIYPQIPNIAPYHNNGIWPFVQSFYTLAAAKQKQTDIVAWSYASILRQASLFLTNKENMVAEDGDFAGTVLNSDRQLWSVAGQLGMNLKLLAGINLTKNGIEFKPVIPKSFSGTYELNNFKYRDAILHIKVKGYGTDIFTFSVDGEFQKEFKLPKDIIGSHIIEIVMNSKENNKGFNLVSNKTTPETPKVSYEKNNIYWTKDSNVNTYKVFKNGKLFKVLKNVNKFEAYKYKETAEYQIQSVDSKGMHSFMSKPILINAKTIDIQAEDFNIKQSKLVSGYSGKGYIVLNKNSNSLKLKSDIKEAGKYFISFRYANGSGPINTDNKCAIRSLYVNENFSHSVVYPQRGNEEWSNWGYTSEEIIELKKGKNKLILKFDDFNENMNFSTNKTYIDKIILRKI
jgi:hypothetical protein